MDPSLSSREERLATQRARLLHEALQHKRVSLVLRAVIDTAPGDSISIREIVEAFGERAFGFVIILFSLPNCIPAPPGMNSIFGLPVLLFACQLALGFKKPWLPKKVMDKTFKVTTFRKIIDKAEPKLRRIENICRPRHTALFGPRGDRLIGVFAIILALCVIVPLPGTNWVPSIALVILSIAIMQEDGLILGLGLFVGMLGVIYTTVLTGALIQLALMAATRAIGI